MLNEIEKMEIIRSMKMTEHDVMKHMKDGVSVYPVNDEGKSFFIEEQKSALFDDEDIERNWDNMDEVTYKGTRYKIDFVL